MKKLFLLGVVLCLCADAVGAGIRLAKIFADGMVLQRQARIPVWGWSEDGGQVTVAVFAAGDLKPLARKTVRAGRGGEWRVELPELPAGGPYQLKVQSGEEDRAQWDVTLSDVLVGDVFLCSGQSNMELPIRRCMDLCRKDVETYANNRIRYVKLPHQFNYLRPSDDIAQILPWVSVTPETCGEIGALCYFFARYMQEETGVPVGIINSSVGGTKVEAWMGQENLSRFEDYKNEFVNPRYHQPDWVDSVRRAETEAGQAWEREMGRTDTVAGRWRTEGYDYGSWPVIDVFKPSAWGKDKPGSACGSHWFRRVVDLPASCAGKPAVVRVGALVDADSVFVNGRFVGYTSYQYPPRIYRIPEGTLREGENEVMVRLMAQNGGPRFVKDKLYQIEVDGEVFPLGSEWQYATGCSMPRKPGSTYFVDTPTGLYNAMIAPLRDYAIRGAVWYQGESNVGNPRPYQGYLEAMTDEWRRQFGRRFPLVIVQLAGFQQRHDRPVETNQAALREAQRLAALNIRNAALATAIDIGEWNDIHPQNKKELGRRVALQMRRMAYKEKRLVASGPMPLKACRKAGQVVVTFDRTTGVLRPDGDLKSIALAASDGKYVWAKARTEGEHRIVADIPEGMEPVSVRYAWDDNPECTIYNREGLPAPSFMLPL